MRKSELAALVAHLERDARRALGAGAVEHQLHAHRLAGPEHVARAPVGVLQLELGDRHGTLARRPQADATRRVSVPSSRW